MGKQHRKTVRKKTFKHLPVHQECKDQVKSQGGNATTGGRSRAANGLGPQPSPPRRHRKPQPLPRFAPIPPATNQAEPEGIPCGKPEPSGHRHITKGTRTNQRISVPCQGLFHGRRTFLGRTVEVDKPSGSWRGSSQPGAADRNTSTPLFSHPIQVHHTFKVRGATRRLRRSSPKVPAAHRAGAEGNPPAERRAAATSSASVAPNATSPCATASTTVASGHQLHTTHQAQVRRIDILLPSTERKTPDANLEPYRGSATASP